MRACFDFVRDKGSKVSCQNGRAFELVVCARAPMVKNGRPDMWIHAMKRWQGMRRELMRIGTPARIETCRQAGVQIHRRTNERTDGRAYEWRGADGAGRNGAVSKAGVDMTTST